MLTVFGALAQVEVVGPACFDSFLHCQVPCSQTPVSGLAARGRSAGLERAQAGMATSCQVLECAEAVPQKVYYQVGLAPGSLAPAATACHTFLSVCPKSTLCGQPVRMPASWRGLAARLHHNAGPL